MLATNKMGNLIVVDGCRQKWYNRPVCIGCIQFTTDRLHIADREVVTVILWLIDYNALHVWCLQTKHTHRLIE